MSTTIVIAELMIIGFGTFITIFFAALLCAGKYDLVFLKSIKDYSAIVLFTLPVVSYLLGIVTYRLTVLSFSIVGWAIPRSLLARVRIWGINVLQREEMWYDCATVIYQHGSTNLTKYIDYEISLGRILQATAFTYPVSAIVVLTWIFKATEVKYQMLIAIVVALAYLGILSVAISQYVISSSLVKTSYEYLKKHNKALRSDSDRPAGGPTGAPEG